MSIKKLVTIISFFWIFLIVCVKYTRLLHLSLLLCKPTVYKDDLLRSLLNLVPTILGKIFGTNLFRANLVPKLEIVFPKQKLVPRLYSVCEIQWWHSLFLFSTGNILFGQIWSKKSKVSAQVEFGTWTNSNTQNSMVVFTFSVLDWKYFFWLNLNQDIKIVYAKIW